MGTWMDGYFLALLFYFGRVVSFEKGITCKTIKLIYFQFLFYFRFDFGFDFDVAL